MDAGELGLDQIGERQIVEEDIEEFLAGEVEDEVVLAFPLLACLALAASTAATTRATTPRRSRPIASTSAKQH